jgi:hypothetical protein
MRRWAERTRQPTSLERSEIPDVDVGQALTDEDRCQADDR